ncbi:MAG: thiamine diphosphokinase [Chitinispirillaceae bacterium]|nr:thiamine diphosphokinase [Chitinispirillaceae bacterium]
MKACIWTNGELNSTKKAREESADADIVIAADGAVRHLGRLGIKPDVIIGDMDSIDDSLRDDDTGIERITYSPEKDKTDTELAVEMAFERGCSQVTLLAAAGGRMDHMLGNIILTAKYPGRVAIIEGNATLVAIDKSQKIRLHGAIGDRISLIPFGNSVADVMTAGLKYGMKKEGLPVCTKGISNELECENACICISAGILLVYSEHSQ